MGQRDWVVTEGKIINKFRLLWFPVNAPIHLVKGCKKNNKQLLWSSQLTLAVAYAGESRTTFPCLWPVTDVYQLKIHGLNCNALCACETTHSFSAVLCRYSNA